MISFLNPWFWLGALAVAAPIWLHLRRKQETNLVRFSALRFLDDAPVPRRSPLRLQDLLLFALRAFALMFVVSAFAWPYRRDADANVIRESRVYVLDNTLSHQAANGFARDRDRILSELDDAGSDVQVAILELSARPRLLATFADDRAAARRKLRELRPSHQRGSYLAAFREAQLLLGNSLGNRRRIIFYGDHQQNQWSEHLNAPPFLDNVEVELAPATAAAAPNLSVFEPRLQRLYLGERSLVNFTVKLTHSGEASNGQVVVRSNDQIILNEPVQLAKQPETILLQAQWEADPTRWQRGEVIVRGEPDLLAADNQAFFTLPPVSEGRVAVLAQSAYLRLALLAEIMRGHWAARLVDPSQLASELSSNRDEDVLCLESRYLQSSEARKLVWRYLTNGRGVLLFVDRVTPAVAGVLRELGFESESNPPPRNASGQSFRYVFSNHPVFLPFRSPDYGNLMEVRVFHYSRLKPVQGVPLIYSEAGDPLFFEGTKFPGKLFVASFGLEREHTSWSTHLTFIPFLDLCLQNARREDATPHDYEPAQTAVLTVPANVAVREVILRDGNTELQRTPVQQGLAQLQLPDQPGLYHVTYDDRQDPARIFSVNPSAKESELKYEQSPTVEVWKLDSRAPAAKARPMVEPLALSRESMQRQQFWWWLLLAGLGALAFETTLASLKRNETSHSNPLALRWGAAGKDAVRTAGAMGERGR